MVKSFGSCDTDFKTGAEQACGCIEFEGPEKDLAVGWLGNELGVWYVDADGKRLTRKEFAKDHGNDPLAQKHIQDKIKAAGYFEIALKEPLN